MAQIRWETHVEPYLDDILKYKQEDLLNEKQIAEKLGIRYTLFKEYKSNSNKSAIKREIDTSALMTTLKAGDKSRTRIIEDTLFMKASGKVIKEKKKYKIVLKERDKYKVDLSRAA